MWYQYVCFERPLKLEPEGGGGESYDPCWHVHNQKDASYCIVRMYAVLVHV